MNEEALERVRVLCMEFPDTVERLSHGEPTWFYKGKRSYAMFADHHHNDRLAFWAAAPEGAQQALVGADPVHYFVPPYVGTRGWIGVYLDVTVDWDEIAEVIGEAYREIALKK